MPISTSQFYDSGAARMARLSQAADRLQTQISTGKRLDAPSQDVAAYRRLATIRRDNADGAAHAANIILAQGLLQQSDTTLTAVEAQLQRATELVVQADSDTLSDANRQVIATQLRGVLDDLVGLANTKDSRGQPLFAAAAGDAAVTRAADGTVSFAGSGESAAIPIGDGNDVQATDSAARVFGGTPDIFAVLATFAAALDAGGSVKDAAGVAGAGVKAALTQVTNVHGAVGARAARLDLEADRQTQAATDREIDRSALEDTDLTTAITELQKTMTVLQATQGSFSKLSQLSLFDYLR